MPDKIYVTSFCNFAHRLKNGRPVNHECYIIPPALLKIEMEEPDFEKVKEAWAPWYKNKGRPVKERKR